MNAFRLASAVLLVSCTHDPPPLDGPHFHYVVSDLQIPASNTEARANAIDLNGDDAVDNQLGQILGLLDGQGLGVGNTVRTALVRGGLIMLADLQTRGFDNAPIAGFTTFLGADPSPVPCTDPSRLETCGQHLQGTGAFTVQPGTTSTTAIGAIEDGIFLHDGGDMPVQLVIDEQSPAIRLDLHHARVELSGLGEGHAAAILGGGVAAPDIVTVIVPQAQAQIDRIVRTECGLANAPAPCGCPVNSRADLLQKVFDLDDDCGVSTSEVAENSLTQSLLAPDITIGGEDFLSFAVRVELAPATFTTDE